MLRITSEINFSDVFHVWNDLLDQVAHLLTINVQQSMFSFRFEGVFFKAVKRTSAKTEEESMMNPQWNI